MSDAITCKLLNVCDVLMGEPKMANPWGWGWGIGAHLGKAVNWLLSYEIMVVRCSRRWVREALCICLKTYTTTDYRMMGCTPSVPQIFQSRPLESMHRFVLFRIKRMGCKITQQQRTQL